MVKIKGFKDLFNKIRLIWISLIFKIKNFFSDNTDKSSNTSSNKQNENGDEIDSEGEQEVWYDALEGLTEQELDEDEYFYAVEHLNEQEAMLITKEKNVRRINTTAYKMAYRKKLNLIAQRTPLHLLLKSMNQGQEISVPISVNLNYANLNKMVINIHSL